MRQPIGNRAHRYRRGIGCQQTVIGDEGFELLKQAALDVDVFNNRLDHQTRGGGAVERVDGFDPGQYLCGIVLAEFAPGDQFLEA